MAAYRHLPRAIAAAFSAALLMLALLAPVGLLAAPGGLGDAAARRAPVDAQAQTAPARGSIPEIHCNVRHLGDCLDAMLDTANKALVGLLTRIPLLILAALVVLIAHGCSRFVGNRLHLLRIRSQNPYMSNLVRMIVRTAIMLVGILVALQIVGLTAVVGAVLGSAGVVGLVLGFAFRDITENYIAGVLLSVRRPFEPGDHVVIENREGRVIAVNSRTTVLMTLDGSQLQLPNSLVFKSVVLNYSRNPKRRFDFTMPIDHNQSIRKAQTLAMAAIADIDGVLDEPAPSWSVVEYGTAAIQLRFLAWVNQRETDTGKVRSEAIRRVKAAFAEAGIEPPRSVHHVVASRARDAEAFETVLEPENGADTSVNRELDVQVAAARRQNDALDLLDSNGGDGRE